MGTSAWRRYLRKKVDSKTHDLFTLYVAKNAPLKVPDSSIPEIISSLQEQGVAVFALTARGRSEWYSSRIDNIDLLTEGWLKNLNIDFTRTLLPSEFENLEEVLAEYYHGGVFYTGKELEKEDFLKKLFQVTGYYPKKVVLIDDKMESLESVEAMMLQYGIPFVGFAYSKAFQNHSKFDLMVSHIQLNRLIFRGELPSNDDAMMIKIETQVGVDPEQYFTDLIQNIDLESLQ